MDVGKNGVDLATLLDEGADLVDLEMDEDDDPDAKQDPLYAVDLKKYLISFLRLAFCSIRYVFWTQI